MNAAQCRHRLLRATGLTYRQWAMAKNLNPRTVTQAVNRYAGRHTLPRGRLTFQILRDLSDAIGAEVVRGILE